MFPGGSDGKEFTCNAGDSGSIPGSGRSPGEGSGWLLTPAFLPGTSHGRRSLAGYSPWVTKSQIQLTLSHSVVKRNKLLIQTTIWMHLKGILLSEKSQFHNVTYHMMSFTWYPQND